MTRGSGTILRRAARRRVTGCTQFESNSSDLKPPRAAARFSPAQQRRCGSMDAQLTVWKRAADELAAADTFDHRAAAQLAGEIARQGTDATLQQAAAQALPPLRAAVAKGADRRAKAIAERRFAAVRDALHAATLPRFGKRERADRMLTPEERYRRLLGLPLERRLFGPEINQAYKQAAKKVHPDAGGSQGAFLELAEARDALMKRL
jgi:hypothetical protein